MKIKPYIIVTSYSAEGLALEICDMIERIGYMPHGDMIYVQHDGTKFSRSFIQAMIYAPISAKQLRDKIPIGNSGK